MRTRRWTFSEAIVELWFAQAGVRIGEDGGGRGGVEEEVERDDVDDNDRWFVRGVLIYSHTHATGHVLVARLFHASSRVVVYHQSAPVGFSRGDDALNWPKMCLAERCPRTHTGRTRSTPSLLAIGCPTRVGLLRIATISRS